MFRNFRMIGNDGFIGSLDHFGRSWKLKFIISTGLFFFRMIGVVDDDDDGDSRGTASNDVAAAAVSCIVYDMEKVAHSLPQLWLHRRTVCVLMRHFGCRVCKAEAAALNAIFATLQKHDIALIAVGIGSHEHALVFKERTAFKGEVYYEPSVLEEGHRSAVYRTLGCNAGAQFVYNDASNPTSGFLFNVAKATDDLRNAGFLDEDFWTEMPEAAVTQLGGVFVVGPGNTCDYAFRSSFMGDLVDVKQLFSAAVGQRHHTAGTQRDDDETEYIYPSTERWVSRLKAGVRAPDIAAVLIERKRAIQIMSGLWLASMAYILLGGRWWLSFLVLVSPFLSDSILHIWNKYKAWSQRQQLRQIRLYTPTEIDAIALKLGRIECDCSFTQETDVINHSNSLSDDRSRVQHCFVHSLSTYVHQTVDNVRDLESFMEINCYLRSFLSKSHPLVGRKGPVCPFMPLSLRKDTVYLGAINVDGLDAATVAVDVARSFVQRFPTLSPMDGSAIQYKAVVLVFPDLPIVDAKNVIDGTQLLLKPEFVSKGLMIGEFHLLNNARGLRNPDFYPLRTPIPALAIRHIVASDLAFMALEHYPVALQIDFLQSFIRNFQQHTKHIPQVEEAKHMLENLVANTPRKMHEA